MTETQIQSRKQAGSQRVKPVFIKASEVQVLTIWDTHRKMERARAQGNLQLLRMNGQIVYNLNNIDPRFLKQNQIL